MVMISALDNLERISSYPFVLAQPGAPKCPAYELFLGPPGKDKFLPFCHGVALGWQWP